MAAAWLEAARRVAGGGGLEYQNPDGSWTKDWPELPDEIDGVTIDGPEGIYLDQITAGMLVAVADALNDANRAKFEALDLLRAVTVGWKLVSKHGTVKMVSG